jgi:hypothetical protein
MSEEEECLPPKLTANLLIQKLGLPENVSNRIEAVLSKNGQHGGGILDCGSLGSVFNYSVMIAVAITGIGACYYDSYPAFKTLTFMLKGGNTTTKTVQKIGSLIGYKISASQLIKETTMNAIKSVLSGNSSNLPEWLFNIVKHICEHPHESSEKEIAEIIHNKFGKNEGIKTRGGKASYRKASYRKARKSKKKMYNRKRTQRK